MMSDSCTQLRLGDGACQHLSAYLYRIARHLITDRYRRRPLLDMPYQATCPHPFYRQSGAQPARHASTQVENVVAVACQLARGVSSTDKEATRTAATALGTPTSSGAGQAARTLLFDAVIELLTARAGG
jgi:hypothetical protein